MLSLKHFLFIFSFTASSLTAQPSELKIGEPENNASKDSVKEHSANISDDMIFATKRSLAFLDIDKSIPSLIHPPLHNQRLKPPLMLPDGTLWRHQTEVYPWRLAGMAGGVAVIGTFGYLRLKDLQYDHPTTKFHTKDFIEDLKIYHQMDKYGHFLHAYFASDLASRLYRWAGFSGESSIWYGTLTGWLWILQIEIADAFFEAWGFSWGDLMFNTLGSGFSALQQLYPKELGGIQPKFSYYPSAAFKEKRYYTEAKAWMDDYEGITWWLGVNVYHYLPEKIQNDYPGWLKPFGIAIGQSAEGIADSKGKREVFVGLDFDLRKLPYGDDSGLIRFLKNEFNIIRLPLPAVRLTPSGIWYGLYF